MHHAGTVSQSEAIPELDRPFRVGQLARIQMLVSYKIRVAKPDAVKGHYLYASMKLSEHSRHLTFGIHARWLESSLIRFETELEDPSDMLERLICFLRLHVQEDLG